jgi:zinc finger protein
MSHDLFKPLGDIADAAGGGAGGAPAASGEAGGAEGVTDMTDNVTVIPSLCMACHETGVTRILLTRIPFFRDVILMAFECEECGYRNSEVQSAEVQEKGCLFEATVRTQRDLNRQLVKSDRAAVRIPELDFEIPAITQKGVFTTVEGLLSRAIDNLAAEQPLRRAVDADMADKVDAFLVRLTALREGGTLPFTLVLDDPSGNSFLENPLAPRHDPNLKVRPHGGGWRLCVVFA